MMQHIQNRSENMQTPLGRRQLNTEGQAKATKGEAADEAKQSTRREGAQSDDEEDMTPGEEALEILARLQFQV